MIFVDSVLTKLPTNAAYRSFSTVCTFQKVSVVTQLCESLPYPTMGINGARWRRAGYGTPRRGSRPRFPPDGGAMLTLPPAALLTGLVAGVLAHFYLLAARPNGLLFSVRVAIRTARTNIMPKPAAAIAKHTPWTMPNCITHFGCGSSIRYRRRSEEAVLQEISSQTLSTPRPLRRRAAPGPPRCERSIARLRVSTGDRKAKHSRIETTNFSFCNRVQRTKYFRATGHDKENRITASVRPARSLVVSVIGLRPRPTPPFLRAY